MSREAYTAEAVQQAIAQGAITEAYQADPQQVIQALNRLRATEVTSYLQYKQHAYMAAPCSRRVSKMTLKRMPRWNSSTRICWPSGFNN
jgi:hypothetical protein